MRNILSIIMLITALAAVAYSKHHPPGQHPPMFPGHGPFNPHQPKPWGGHKPSPHRFRRSPEPKKNRLIVEGQRSGGSSSYNVDYGRKVYENKHGSVSLHGGMNKEPHGGPQKHIGIQGKWDF